MNPYEPGTPSDLPTSGQVLSIQKVDPWSVGRIMGGLYGALALIMSAFLLVGGIGTSLIGAVAGGDESGVVAALGTGVFSIVMAVMLPIIYGGMAFLMGALMGALYNLAARWFGGISFTVG